MSVPAGKIKTCALVRALRLTREEKGITREQLGDSLGVSYKAIEKIENGRLPLTSERKEKILKVLGIDEKELKRIKKHGVVHPKKREKSVTSNEQRRSYKKLITKEVRVLIHLRKVKQLSQDEASKVCGYSRPTIGHIENGRIEIPVDRLRHIVSSYGFQFAFFEGLMKEEFLRDEIIKTCYDKLLILSEQKLKLVQSMLANL